MTGNKLYFNNQAKNQSTKLFQSHTQLIVRNKVTKKWETHQQSSITSITNSITWKISSGVRWKIPAQQMARIFSQNSIFSGRRSSHWGRPTSPTLTPTDGTSAEQSPAWKMCSWMSEEQKQMSIFVHWKKTQSNEAAWFIVLFVKNWCLKVIKNTAMSHTPCLVVWDMNKAGMCGLSLCYMGQPFSALYW